MSRTLPLRRWLVLALAVAFVMPTMLTGVVVYHLLGQPVDAGEAAGRLLRAEASQWADPSWQTATSAELGRNGVDFVLIEGGREIYRSAVDPLAGVSEQQSRVVQRIDLPNTTPPKTAYIYADQAGWPPSGRYLLVPIVAVSSLLTTLVGIGWFLGRMVTRPLAANNAAARRVADGDLDITLPASRVREVAEVNTAFVSMSAALKRSLQRQSSLEQERRLFIGAVVHDLRTPLFSLRGYLEGMEEGLADTPEKLARYVAVAQEKAAALDRLIADLFDYTRLEYLDQTPKRAPLDVALLLRRLIDGLQPQAEMKGVALALESSPGPCMVDGDSHLLTRAIENLLDNAVRYTPAGGSVRAKCHRLRDRVIFSISDSGPGIPAHDLPHLFRPLYRGETSRNRRTGGAGLGLATARSILQAHGGEIEAANGVGGGAVFTVWLPTTTRSEPETEEPERAPAPGPVAKLQR